MTTPPLAPGTPDPHAGRRAGQARGDEARPRLLDLFCGAGGCAVGYSRAGFDVVGVDIEHQPRYPFEFVQGDALWMLETLVGGGSICPTEDTRYWLRDFDAIHASPPCQRYSVATGEANRNKHPDLIGRCRELLLAIDRPWVIENVGGSPLGGGATLLCGSMFGMRIRHHRFFESSHLLLAPGRCRHKSQGVVLSVTGTGYGGKHKGHNGTKPSGVAEAREVMGIDWMTIDELSKAIPPTYTEWIGGRLMEALPCRA